MGNSAETIDGKRIGGMQNIPADRLLAENLRALLAHRGIDAKDLARWCGHGKAWISKVLALDRGIAVKELGKVADFFGLTVSQLFSPGISALYERRRGERRTGGERRQPQDRRFGGDRTGQLHPDSVPRFAPRRRGDPPDSAT